MSLGQGLCESEWSKREIKYMVVGKVSQNVSHSGVSVEKK